MTTYSVESFLQGGGELGELIRSKDWDQTPLGNPSNWPQPLKTAVRIILTSRQPMFVWWGKDLVNIYNDAYKSILGGKHPTALGQPARVVWSEIWPEIGPRARQCMEQDTGTYDEALLLIMERNGYPEETYYTFSYSPVAGEDGKPQGIICANTDDTSRIIGERQMRTLRDLAKNILHAKTNQEIYEKTLEALEGNPRDFPFLTLYEISGDGKRLNLVGKVPADLSQDLANPDIDLDAQSHKFPEVVKAIETSEMQLVSGIADRFGTLAQAFWDKTPENALLIPILQTSHKFPFALLAVGLNPFRLINQDYLGFFNLVGDQIATALTNSYALKRERKRAEALAEIDKAKTIFFSNISHEFRTPLTLMLGPLEEMLNNPGSMQSPSDLKNIETTHRNAMRLLKLVNSLLDFSRIEAGRVQAKFRGICLGQFTEELASSFRSLFEKAGLGFEVVTDVKSAAYVDTDMWEKIVLNLLSNAYKYTLSGKVSVSVLENAGFVELKVSDTGTGIPAHEMPHLFERFHRVKNSEGRSFEGTGIGLSLVKELVKLNHAEISVQSEHGKGSTFTVTVPTGKAHLDEEDIVDGDTDFIKVAPNVYADTSIAPEPAQAEQQLHDPGIHKNAKVLVVDDNQDMRDYVSRLLEKHYLVITAENGAIGLEKAFALRPDLIISDVMMPVMDGIEMMQKIKSAVELSRIPVLLLSARAGEEAKIEGYDFGADDYLVKPFSARELLARVHSQLRLAHARNHVNDQLRNAIMQAPVAIALLRGDEFVVEIANEKMMELWGRDSKTMLNQPVFEGLPEAERQGFKNLMQGVYSSGKRFRADEAAIELVRNGVVETIYVKFLYEPYYDENGSITGIMVVADEVTASVSARNQVEQSEMRHKLAIEAARMGSFEWAIHSDDFFYSPRLAEIFGYDGNQDFRHTDFINRFHPDDRAIRDEAIETAMETGTLFYEARVVWPDESVHWIRLNGRLERDMAGQAYKMFGTVLDITDERLQTAILEEKVYERTKKLAQKNRELEESEERYQRMTEEVQDYAILLLDTNGIILNWNKGAEKIKGYSEADIVGKSFTEFYLPEDRESGLPYSLIEEARNVGRAVHEGYRMRKDGTVFWALVTITALHDDEGNVIGFSKVTRDLTERKLQEDRLQRVNAELEFQNRELEQFAYVASHDLQEPLRKIQMFSGMLERNLHEAEVAKMYFEKINSSAERMSELIRAVLNYSRLSRIDEHFTNVDLNEILRNVLVDFELLAHEKQAKIHYGHLPNIIAISLQINQLLSNLIGNALKFTERRPEITIASRTLLGSEIPFETNLYPDRVYLELTVADNGIGFDEKYSAQIFTIFQRLNQRTAFSGTGIGLALCKKIVENHQGFISATSKPGEGATFSVYLPA